MRLQSAVNFSHEKQRKKNTKNQVLNWRGLQTNRDGLAAIIIILHEQQSQLQSTRKHRSW